MGLDATVTDRYSNGITALELVGVSRTVSEYVPKAQQSWMTVIVYFPRRFYIISDLTHEYLVEVRMRGNNEWSFISI